MFSIGGVGCKIGGDVESMCSSSGNRGMCCVIGVCVLLWGMCCKIGGIYLYCLCAAGCITRPGTLAEGTNETGRGM